MKHLWFLSIPGAPSRHEAYAKTFNSLDLRQMERFGRLYVPCFQLVTYDNLVDMMNNLVVLDRISSSLFRRMEDKLLELIPRGYKLMTTYSVIDKDFVEYLEVFQWDKRKYPEGTKISQVAQGLSEDINDMADQFNYFNIARRDAVMAMEAIARKKVGTVTMREVNSLIPDESYVVESKNLTTLFLVVPKHLSKLWKETYELITHHIVPDSSRLIGSDSDFDLYNLVIWKQGAEAFREFMSTETEITFRAFHFDRDAFLKAKEMEDKMQEKASSATHQLVAWLRINFRRIYLLTIHAKLLRLHVESLIRFGVPYRFQIIYLQPKKKKIKYLTKEFQQMFAHLELKITKEVKKSGVLNPNYTTYPFTTMTLYMPQ